jgi:hypothetical protein
MLALSGPGGSNTMSKVEGFFGGDDIIAKAVTLRNEAITKANEDDREVKSKPRVEDAGTRRTSDGTTYPSPTIWVNSLPGAF